MASICVSVGGAIMGSMVSVGGATFFGFFRHSELGLLGVFPISTAKPEFAVVGVDPTIDTIWAELLPPQIPGNDFWPRTGWAGGSRFMNSIEASRLPFAG